MIKPWLTLGASALILSGSLAGAFAYAANSEAAAVSAAHDQATRAEKLLWSGKSQKAVKLLEGAVALRPADAAYRALLGQAYMKDGRLGSARQAFLDALTLDPANPRVALNLALAQIANGDWTGARKTLDDHAALIPVRDRGLAIALAGDPNTAVDLLTAAAKSPDADAKTRQNLGLALAMAGRWQESQAVAAVDLPPDQVSARIEQWARFAHPQGAADQVATLLGVTPVQDPGEPTQLALATPSAPVALAAAAPVDKFMPGPASAAAAAAPTPVATAAAPPIASAAAEISPPVVAVTAAPTVATTPEMASVPAAPIKVAHRPVGSVVARATKTVPSHTASRGSYYVQIGAFPNATVAHDAWKRARVRFAAFREQSPTGVTIKVRGISFYRLSVGGFGRGDADGMCRAWRGAGGSCFVRTAAGDTLASWLRRDAPRLAAHKAKSPQLAAR